MSKMLTSAQTQQLRRTLATGSRLGASDLRIINVDVYRERLGKEWPKYKDIINAYAAEAIKVELGKDDFFVETKNGYGIFYFKKDLDEVRLVSERISERLRAQLSRDAIFGDPPLGCESVSVNCDEFVRQLEAEARSVPAAAPSPSPSSLAAKMAGATAEPQPVPGSYAPFWHAKLERIVGSIYVPNIPPSVRRTPDREYYAPSSIRVHEDIRRFNAMLTDAYKLHKAGQSTAIFFSLNFKSFCEPEFVKEYMQVLRQTPASLLKYLTPRFVRIPPGTPPALTASRVQTLTTVFRHVVLQERPPVDLRSLEFVPCSILAMSWKDAVYSAGRDARALEKLVSAFCTSARMLRANSLIEGVDTPEAFEISTAAGAEFMSGLAFAPTERNPFAQRTLTLAGIRASHRRGPPPSGHNPQQTANEIDFIS